MLFEKTALARAEAGGLTDRAADRCDQPAGRCRINCPQPRGSVLKRRKPRACRAFDHAPKRTRTTTRLSRTRPSTWRPTCQIRPDRAPASISSAEMDASDGLDDLDVVTGDVTGRKVPVLASPGRRTRSALATRSQR